VIQRLVSNAGRQLLADPENPHTMLLLHGRDRLNGAQDYALAFAVLRQGRAGIQVQPVAKLLRDGDAARCIQSDRGIHRNIVADAAQFCQRIRRAGSGSQCD
jgi:hypothetical protein